MTLTNEQASVLTKIASRSKMDCWFYLDLDHNNNYIAIDLEQNLQMDLEEAIYMLLEGMTAPQDYELTAKEINILIQIKKEVNYA